MVCEKQSRSCRGRERPCSQGNGDVEIDEAGALFSQIRVDGAGRATENSV